MKISEFITLLEKLPADYDIKILSQESLCFCDFFESDLHLEFDEHKKPYIGLGFLDL